MKKILIYDRLFFFSKGLQSVIKNNFANTDVFLVFCPNIFIEECSRVIYDIVIFDFINDDTFSFNKLKKIKKLQPKSKLVVMCENDSNDFRMQCASSNVDFLMLKNCSEHYLVAALKLALYGNTYFTKDLRLNVPKKNSQDLKSVHQNKISALSPREYEIAMLMIKGLSTTKISVKLKVEKTTISTYKRRIFEKTKTSNIIEIAKILDIK